MSESFIRTWESNLAFRGEMVNIVMDYGVSGDYDLLTMGHIIGLDIRGALLLRKQSGDEVALHYGKILDFENRALESSEMDVLRGHSFHLRAAGKCPKIESQQ